MQVETFEMVEVMDDGTAQSYAPDEEAVKLINDMSLIGQRIYAGLDEGSEATEPTAPAIPYKPMTHEEVGVYHTLYPSRSEVSTYDQGPIPLRVLQVIALCKQEAEDGERMFERLEVWHAKALDPDPLLVGVLNHCTYSVASQKNFLLARWGEALEPYGQQMNKAADILRERRREKLAKIKAEVEQEIALVDARATATLIDGAFDSPSFFAK